MKKQRRSPHAIAIARADKGRSQYELLAYGATLVLFAITALALFPSL
jgi:hypothetical protein